MAAKQPWIYIFSVYF